MLFWEDGVFQLFSQGFISLHPVLLQVVPLGLWVSV